MASLRIRLFRWGLPAADRQWWAEFVPAVRHSIFELAGELPVCIYPGNSGLLGSEGSSAG